MAPRTKPSSGLRVLVVDDNAVNRKIADFILLRLGHTTVQVSRGTEALAALDTADFDIVLMDVQMPEMDGLEATRRIRRRGVDELNPYIIALTAHENRQTCLEAGMNDHLQKPLEVQALQRVLEKYRSITPRSA